MQARVGLGTATACALGGVISVQIGASFGKGLFDSVAPTTATWLRLAAASVLLGLVWLARRLWLNHRTSSPASPSLRDRSPRAWLIALGYGACLLGMNWSIYEAFARLPVGIAVTLEFLGPLTVAVLGSRRLLDLVWVALAGLGVALLGSRPAPLNPVGLVFVLVAAACWAGYILLGGRLGRHWDGFSVLTLACLGGALFFAVPGISAAGPVLWTPAVLGTGLLVGLLSSAVPYTLELIALGNLPAAVFAILESLSPAIAALAAGVLLSEALGSSDWLAIGCVVAASIGATLAGQRRSPR